MTRVRETLATSQIKELEKRHPGFRVVYALSDLKPGDQWDGEKGFIHLSVQEHVDAEGKRQAFLCGQFGSAEALAAESSSLSSLLA